mmetsp:Transcript_85740/g.227853  ORF Transcript_85740/g.227853 Transcript_85740/m.227853 type:complete len:202 (-) Transcript_85740:62-667(-)
MEFLGSFCSSGTCSGRLRATSSATGSRPSRQEEPRSTGSIFEHVSLRPSVVDDGELLFAAPRPVRQTPPRGSSAPRQRGAGSRHGRQAPSYAAADASDFPPSGRPAQWTALAPNGALQAMSLTMTAGTPVDCSGLTYGSLPGHAALASTSRPLSTDAASGGPPARTAASTLQALEKLQAPGQSLNLEGCGAVSAVAQSLRG